MMKAEMYVHGQGREDEQAKYEVFNNPEFGWGLEKCINFPISQARHPVKLESITHFCQ